MREFSVEVTKTEIRTYKTTVAVFSDLPRGKELDEVEMAWEDDVNEKAEETARQLGDEEWEETTDPSGGSITYDIEGVEDDKT